MKREKNSNFNYFLVMTIFTVCYLVTFILSSKTISMGKLIATAGATIYPVTYFISTLFCERYGKKHSLLMIIYTVTALVIATILIAIATALPIYNDTHLFSFSINAMLASIAGFIIGQSLNLYIYYYLEEKNGFSFLIAAVIAITVDNLIFISLGFIGVYDISYIIRLFTGQYVISIISILIYSLCYAYLIPALKERKNREKELKYLEKTMVLESLKKEIKKEEKKEEKPKTTKKETVKKTVAKKPSTKKTTVKKETTKKATK